MHINMYRYIHKYTYVYLFIYTYIYIYNVKAMTPKGFMFYSQSPAPLLTSRAQGARHRLRQGQGGGSSSFFGKSYDLDYLEVQGS